MITQEANAISTANLRFDTLPPDQQPAVRQLFREYLSARLRVYDALFTPEIANRERAQAARWQRKIWEKTIDFNRADPTLSITWLILPALNEMFDVASSRTIAERAHLPGIILALLFSVALLSAFLSGFGMAPRRRRALLHTGLYAAVVSLTVYVVLDLDYPRSGLIHLDAAQEMIRQLRDGMP